MINNKVDTMIKILQTDGLLIKYVDQTEERCIAAVKQNGLALKYVGHKGKYSGKVIKQTKYICYCALYQNLYSSKYVDRSVMTYAEMAHYALANDLIH
jgi:hypothetical protein